MRAIIVAGVLIAAAAPAYGQKDTAIDLADVTYKPALLSHPELGYKDCYKDAGLTGTDVVKFVVDTSGHVEALSVGLTQVTHPILDSLAVRVVRGMVFTAGAMAGAKVRVSVGLPVHFGNGQSPASPDSVIFSESCVDKKAQPVGEPSASGVPVGMVKADSLAPGVTTQVQMRVEVNSVGEVVEATAKDAAVPLDLAQGAVVAARRMKFQPARIDGNYVASWVTIRVPVSR